MNDPTAPPPVVRTVAELREMLLPHRHAGRQIGFVPTMGALHAGHLSLVEQAKAECGVAVVSVFVNPTQFGPGEDFDRYPRQLDDDCRLLAGAGADLVFAPGIDEVYPGGFSTLVQVTGLTDPFEGAIRPGHFQGVTTVVLKLLNMVQPQAAYFGQKDYQQSVVVRRMVFDLNVPTEIRVCPIVREPDGLAMSSRNAYLSVEQRQQALTLARSLRRAAELVAAGEEQVPRVLAAMRRVFADEPAVKVDYLAIVQPETLHELSVIRDTGVALVAARVGSTRLIDNAVLQAARG